jgi:hypothetical protein
VAVERELVMGRKWIVASVAVAIAAGGTTAAGAAIAHRSESSCRENSAAVYHGRFVTPIELCRLQQEGKADAFRMGTGTPRAFDSEAEMNAYDRKIILARLPRARGLQIAATRRCFGPLVGTAHGLSATVDFAGNTARVWPRPIPAPAADLSSAQTGWAARFFDPVSESPRTNGAMRFAVWSWSHHPTQTQDAKLRARVRACDAASTLRS